MALVNWLLCDRQALLVGHELAQARVFAFQLIVLRPNFFELFFELFYLLEKQRRRRGRATGDRRSGCLRLHWKKLPSGCNKIGDDGLHEFGVRLVEARERGHSREEGHFSFGVEPVSVRFQQRDRSLPSRTSIFQLLCQRIDHGFSLEFQPTTERG